MKNSTVKDMRYKNGLPVFKRKYDIDFMKIILMYEEMSSTEKEVIYAIASMPGIRLMEIARLLGKQKTRTIFRVIDRLIDEKVIEKDYATKGYHIHDEVSDDIYGYAGDKFFV